jgi:predicted ester cyclase
MKKLAVTLVALALGCKSGESGNKPAAPTASSKPGMMAPATSAASSAAKKLAGDDLAKAAIACMDAWNSHDPAKSGACDADDVKVHIVDSGLPDAMGRAAATASDQMFWKAFSDLKGSPQLVLVNGNHVGIVALFTGTNDGDFMGKPATKKKSGIYAFLAWDMTDDGKIKEDWTFVDFVTVMAQLGMMPPQMKDMKVRPVVEKGVDKPEIVVAKNDANEKANVDAITKSGQAMAKADWKTMMDGVADNVVEKNQTEAEDITGKDKMQKGLEKMGTQFKDMKLDNITTWGAGDYVVDLSKMSMTFIPMNKPVNLTWAHVFKLSGGKVAELWGFADNVGSMIQLGLMPAPGAAPAASAPATSGAASVPAAPAASSKK